MGVVVYWFRLYGNWDGSGSTVYNALILVASIVLGSTVFLLISLLLRTGEALYLLSLIKRRIRP
jgi:hypothetical protein